MADSSGFQASTFQVNEASQLSVLFVCFVSVAYLRSVFYWGCITRVGPLFPQIVKMCLPIMSCPNLQNRDARLRVVNMLVI